MGKLVVSSTLGDPGWENSTVLRGPVADEVRATLLETRPFVSGAVNGGIEEDGPDRRGNRLNVRRVADRATGLTLCRSDRLNVPPVALRRAAFTSSR